MDMSKHKRRQRRKNELALEAIPKAHVLLQTINLQCILLLQKIYRYKSNILLIKPEKVKNNF